MGPSVLVGCNKLSIFWLNMFLRSSTTIELKLDIVLHSQHEHGTVRD